ncbi:MAG: CBS domain-containing protein [Pirellulales bacterium]|nr:CBS domain-containing protein [Pirellulales bacterium]
MSNAWERLLSLKVADLVHRDVVTVAAHDGMTHAAATLLAHEVSGAPVVDEQGRLVGMLSAIDFVRRAHCCDAPQIASAGGNALGQAGDDRPYRVDELPHDHVSRFMSPGVQTIAASASLLSAAQIMCAEHVHRLPVIDASGRPCGVITSLDLVAALFNAVEEQRPSQQTRLQPSVTPT